MACNLRGSTIPAPNRGPPPGNADFGGSGKLGAPDVPGGRGKETPIDSVGVACSASVVVSPAVFSAAGFVNVIDGAFWLRF